LHSLGWYLTEERPGKPPVSRRDHLDAVNDRHVGSILRALRHRIGLRQSDIANRAGVSQQLVSAIERGGAGTVAGHTLRQIFAAVDADAITVVRWRGGELDRLLDEGHADIVGRMVVLLETRGWTVLPEATYSEWGERGSIDILAWHPASRTLLVVEVKTEIASVEELLRRHDAKVRLAPRIAEARFGGRPTRIAKLLVVAESSTNRRRVARTRAVLEAAYPARGRRVRDWLRDPTGEMAGVLFLTGHRGTRARRRIRHPGPAAIGPTP
jgi:transcriptional regulator with XRE-family HTH domain